MRRYYIALLSLFLLVFQGMAMSLLPANLVYSDLLITPHWVLVLLLLTAIFYDREDTYVAVVYAIIFGLLIDVVYTGILGVYMITYTLIAYTIFRMNKWLVSNFLGTFLLVVIGIVLADTMLYMVYSFVQVTEMTWGEYALFRLLPTLAANMIFFVVLYPLVKGKLEKWSSER
ncbi:rod shape-determining protein MreD [Halobacillus fulvus]|nr:rod shape-determining protein MreD [Halobacillus fulvus]